MAPQFKQLPFQVPSTLTSCSPASIFDIAMNPIRPVLLLASALLLNGCILGGHWIEGKWRYDAERTKAANTSTQQGDSGPVLSRLKGLLGGAVEGVMSASLENAVLEFTGTEIRTKQGDSGTSVPYKIIEKPDANTVVIQRQGNKIETYHRDGADIWFKPADALDVKVYLKRAS